ncbi:MAG: hypothetical protein J2P21_18335, partial [Chloracidobacterium sp.]|nr:hypothetical protein [Chloracidobacterium sp.]
LDVFQRLRCQRNSMIIAAAASQIDFCDLPTMRISESYEASSRDIYYRSARQMANFGSDPVVAAAPRKDESSKTSPAIEAWISHFRLCRENTS